MYVRRIRGKDQRWGLMTRPSKYLIHGKIVDPGFCQTLRHPKVGDKNFTSQSGLITKHILSSFPSEMVVPPSRRSFSILRGRFCTGLKNIQFRVYSTEGDGRNNKETRHTPVKDEAKFDKEKVRQETVRRSSLNCDSHARLGELDQKEWLNNEKLAIERKNRDTPFLTRHQKFTNEFFNRVIPWEQIHVSWESFPYYIHDHTKSLLAECVTSHLKHKKFTSSYGARLTSSSSRILLQSTPGSELFRERLVKALARDLQVPLLVLDSNVLAPYDFGEGEADDESDEDCTSESEVEDENDASNGRRIDCSDDEAFEGAVESALKNAFNISAEGLDKIFGECGKSQSTKSKAVETSSNLTRPLGKGDRVKYVGLSVNVEADSRIGLGKIRTSDGPRKAYTSLPGRCLSSGQKGEVYEVNHDMAAVILDIDCENKASEEEIGKTREQAAEASVYWIYVKDLERDLETQAEDCYIAIGALYEVVRAMQPIIIYFPDFSQWLSRASPKSNEEDFVHKVQEIFDQLSGHVVLICGQNKIDTGSKQKEKLTTVLPNFGHISVLQFLETFKATKTSDDNEIYRLFANVLCVYPPKEDHLLRTFNKQLEQDMEILISRININELQRVLEEYELSCMDLFHVNTDGITLSKLKAEKVVGWAKNHHLASCLSPYVKGGRLHLPRESLEIAILRLKEQEENFHKHSRSLKNLTKDQYERNFLSAVVLPGETGVRFDDVGALENVKKALNELVILPMKRPALFSQGNLLRPCKGILLFGPPGTGKTLLAKALAAEAGANFISITGSSLTSKWFGDAEKLTKALFSFASKLSPVIIFVDEVDSLLGAHGSASEHEATRKMRNEFMAAWDGLRSKENERILVLGATNRPFDLDDAVIRRLPRRIYVDLPDAENRTKILKVLLAQENLEIDFQYFKLANETEGYSGSDLKNLCIAAAYRPVQELLEDDDKKGSQNVSHALRTLRLDDFIQSKAKVGPSVSYDATSVNELRIWNERYGEDGSRSKAPFGF